MAEIDRANASGDVKIDEYILDNQVGFILRQVAQRHSIIFADRMIEGLTTTQFAAMAKLHEVGPCSQNQLGRLTAMDAATIKGVVDRLTKKEFVTSKPDISDARRRLVGLTKKGRAVMEKAIPLAEDITAETLRPLPPANRITFLKLLNRLR